jgi:hypothetical protein
LPDKTAQGFFVCHSGTVYYRAGTSGDWTSLSVSGTSTTFPVTDTTMQVAHNWNKSGNNYMTPSFRGATNITSIAISQKSFLTGTMGNYFMYYYAMAVPPSLRSMSRTLAVLQVWGLISCNTMLLAVPPSLLSLSRTLAVLQAWGIISCNTMLMAVLTSLDVPDTSSLESVGNYFMRYYAYGCSSLTSLAVPDTSGLTSVGNSFMYYAMLSSLTSAVPDTSGPSSLCLWLLIPH